MENLEFDLIVKEFKLTIEDFMGKICEKFELEVDDLSLLLNNVSFMREEKKDNVKKCDYEFIKGKSSGTTCNNKVSEESKSGKHCKRHLSNKESKTTESKTAKSKTVKSAKSKKQQELAENEIKVIKQLNDSKPRIIIKRNTHGNYEHQETGLVMDRESKKIIGKQKEDGTLDVLTVEDIETCKMWKLTFQLPETITSEKDNEESKEDEDE
jgi:hypothetical protein